MLGDINKNLKPIKPRVSLCKPDGTTIAILSEAYGEQQSFTLGNIDTFEFNLPLKIEKRGKVIDNPHIDMIMNRYLIKIELNNDIKYFVIHDINKQGTQSGEKYYNIKANLLSYQLTDKVFNNYVSLDSNFNESPIDINKALSDALSLSPSWSIGDVDLELQGIYRQFNFTQKTALDFIFEIAQTFNAIIEWDTVNKKVSMYAEKNVGENKGLTISMRKYLQSIGSDSTTDNVATRFYAYGLSGNSIQSVNPTGTPYIEDFSYFLYPYQRDLSGNVISHSNWMSDSLAGAIIDYENLVASKQGEFSGYLDQLNTLNSTLSTQQSDMDNLQTQLNIIDDNLAIQKASNVYHYYDFTYNGSTVTESPALESLSPYAVMVYLSNSSGLTVKLDGTTKSVPAATWTVIGKLNNKTSTSIQISGSTTNVTVKIYVVQITSDQYTSGTNQEILDNYNDDYKQFQIDAKQSDINSTQSQINSVNSNISNLQSTLAIENNFTSAQINEWDNFIISRTYTNTNCVTAQELLTATKDEFNKYKSPPDVITIDIVNFLEVVDAQRDWDKLVIGDIVNTKYENLGINVQAKITQIDIDYDNKTIKLTIANTKDILTDKQKYIKALYQSVSTSTQVNSNSDSWAKGGQTYFDFNSYISGAIDAVKQKILAGLNESVEISHKGILIKDPNDLNKFLVANHAALAITTSGGKTWENAITTDGVIAERLVGNLIAGAKLAIQNEAGSFIVDGNGVTIAGTDLTITGGLPDSQINSVSAGKVSGQLSDGQISSASTWNSRTTKITNSGIYTGSINFNQAQGGTLTLGGNGNGNGVATIKNSSGAPIINMNQNGIQLSNGASILGSTGILSTFVFISGGEQNGWQKCGHWNLQTGSNTDVYIQAYIPSNFIITSATLRTYSMPLVIVDSTGAYVDTWNISAGITKIQDASKGRMIGQQYSEYIMDYSDSPQTNITNVIWGTGTWVPTGNYTSSISGDVKNYLNVGGTTIFRVYNVGGTNSKSLVQMRLEVIGYKQ